MKINKKTISFTSIVSIAVLVLNILFPTLAQAYTFNVGPYSTSINVNEILKEANFSSISQITSDATKSEAENIENRYGFNEDIWRVAKRKGSAPKVELFFDNTNPKIGEKVTAHAIPEFFKNDPQNLYYTWYLIHTSDGTPQTATNSIEAGKREAAKIIARGDYDPNLDGQDYTNSGNDPDKDGWPSIDANNYNENTTAAPMGGADGVGGLSEETVEAFSSAAEWCDSLGDHSWDNCSLYDSSDFKPLATYYTPYSKQNNYYCNLCKDYFTGNGATLYANAQSARNICCYNATPESLLQCSSIDPDTHETIYSKCAYDGNLNYCGTTYNSLFDSCYETFKESNKSTLTTCLNSEYALCKTNWATIHEDDNGDGFSDYSEEDTTQVFRCYKHNFGTAANAGIFRENELSDSATEDPSGLDYSVPCKHKWPHAPNYRSGSGKFSNGEEEYWKTDPNDPDTDGDGFLDEADVIGLGQEEFTWNYQAGDRVGVVVEGTSMFPTDEKTAYYKIMWGYLDVCDSTKHNLMSNDGCDDSGDDGFGFMATKAPGEESFDEQLKISLTYSPDSPVADPSSENKDNIDEDGSILDADQISVTSSLDNTQFDPNLLYYTWQIQKGNPKNDDWGKALDINDNFDTVSSTSGLGLIDFSFTPKKDALSGDDDIIYFKVTVTVSQSSGITSKRGRSSVIIPVNKKGVKIDLYKVDISGRKAIRGEKVCNEGLYTVLCPAVKGQMLAAKISSGRYTASNSEFAWQTNGNALNPPVNASDYFDGWSNTIVFFPITKQEQQIEEISVTVTPKDKLEPVKASRLITVVEPVALIRSSDTNTAWPKTQVLKVGSTKDAFQNINNLNMLETYPGSNVSLYLDFVPYYLIADDENTVIDWQFGGISFYDELFNETYGDLNVLTSNEGKNLSFTASEAIGAYYDLSVNLEKYWSEEEIDIMFNAWDIVPRPLKSDRSVTITTIEEPLLDTTASNKPTQLLAAIGNHLPHYLMYNLRLALTALVMFFISFWFYALIQKIANYYYEEG